MEKHAQKIINLLAVADGGANYNESKVARELAEKLMAKYEISVFKKNGIYVWRTRLSPAGESKSEKKFSNQVEASHGRSTGTPQNNIKFDRIKRELDKKVEDLFREPKQQYEFVGQVKETPYEFPWFYVLSGMIAYQILSCFMTLA